MSIVQHIHTSQATSEALHLHRILYQSLKKFHCEWDFFFLFSTLHRCFPSSLLNDRRAMCLTLLATVLTNSWCLILALWAASFLWRHDMSKGNEEPQIKRGS